MTYQVSNNGKAQTLQSQLQVRENVPVDDCQLIRHCMLGICKHVKTILGHAAGHAKTRSQSNNEHTTCSFRATSNHFGSWRTAATFESSQVALTGAGDLYRLILPALPQALRVRPRRSTSAKSLPSISVRNRGTENILCS